VQNENIEIQERESEKGLAKVKQFMYGVGA